ncbi:MAG: hypothetical protein HRT47_05595 [Candidatus Caenarcaniphilales bacterium]|nr:hypothetical protein [Candidatus Caenarcaniphilales bacterium]
MPGVQKFAKANQYVHNLIKLVSPALILTSSCHKLPESVSVSDRAQQEQICLNTDNLLTYKELQEVKGNNYTKISEPLVLGVDPKKLEGLTKGQRKEILDQALCESEKVFNKYAQSIRRYARRDKVVASQKIKELREFFAPAMQKLYLVQLYNYDFSDLPDTEVKINDLFANETNKFHLASYAKSDSNKLFIPLQKFTEKEMQDVLNDEQMMQDLLDIYKAFDASLSLEKVKEIVKDTNIYFSNEFNDNSYGISSHVHNNIYLNANHFEFNSNNLRENLLRNELSHSLYRYLVFSIEQAMKKSFGTDAPVFKEHKLKTEFISDAVDLLAKENNIDTHKRILLYAARYKVEDDLIIPQYKEIYDFYDKSLRKHIGDKATEELYEDVIRVLKYNNIRTIKTAEGLHKKIKLPDYGIDLWNEKIPDDFSDKAKLELQKIRKFYDDYQP